MSVHIRLYNFMSRSVYGFCKLTLTFMHAISVNIISHLVRLKIVW